MNDPSDSSRDNAELSFSFESLEAVRKKLLDLTGRNSLLNYRHSKTSSLRIVDELPDQVAEVLRSGSALTFMPVSEPTEPELIAAGYITIDEESGDKIPNGYPTSEEWAKYLGIEVSYDLPDKAKMQDGLSHHTDLALQTLHYAPALESKLRNLRSKAETAIEEGGTNILYLALGFLEWYESPDSDQKRSAPLFTLPVRLERSKRPDSSGTFRYNISLKDDGLLTNVTLKEKLSADFAFDLPPIEDATNPENYFEQIASTTLKQNPRWKIRRQASLVLLNFMKQVMYQDLNPDNWPAERPIGSHPILQNLFSSTGAESEQGLGYAEEHPIDKLAEVHDQFPIIYDADSSQHSALVDAVKGSNLVIEGPPGSGKSQTITNLIAASIANGKRVLFVAEKMAALNVVKDRLDRAGLGDFCLELHSHKTNKQKILSDLGTRLNKQGHYPQPREIDAEIARYEDHRKKLSDYADQINAQWKSTGLTIHEIFSGATRHREGLNIAPDKYPVDGLSGESLTVVEQKALADNAHMLMDIYGAVSEQAPERRIENHFWYGTNNTDLLGYQQKELIEALSGWNLLMEEIQQQWVEKGSELQVGSPDSDTLTGIDDFIVQTKTLPELIAEQFLHLLPLVAERTSELETILSSYSEIHQANDRLSLSLYAIAIDDSAAVSVVNSACHKAKDLGVSSEVTLRQLNEKQTSIKRLSVVAASLSNKFDSLRGNLPAEMQSFFPPTVRGMKEFKVFVELVQKLPADLWRYRDPIFDEEELDPLIESMTRQLGVLSPLHTSLKDAYRLEGLPGSGILRDHFATIEGGGFFKWFSSEWRSARASILELGLGAKPKFGPLMEKSADLIAYAEGFEELERINSRSDLMESHYRGVDTPIETVSALRRWYKLVREEYGIGFGERVSIGNCLLTLDRGLATAIEEFLKAEVGSSIDAVLSSVSDFRRVFSELSAIKDEDYLTVEVLNLLDSEMSEINGALGNYVSENSLAISEIQDVAIDLERHQYLLSECRNCNLMKDLSGHSLDLSLAPGDYSEIHLRGLENLLQIARCASKSSHLSEGLLSKPDAERYDALRLFAVDLSQRIEVSSSAESTFVQLGLVDRDQWQAASEGTLSGLSRKNSLAMENPTWLETWLDYLRLKMKLSESGLAKLISGLEENEFSPDVLERVLRMSIYHQLSEEILLERPDLRTFSGMEQMAIRNRFREYDQNIMRLQRQRIAHRASQVQIPPGISSGKVGNLSELGLIKHNLSLKKPRIAVRSLIDRAGEAIQALKPCFMMSPMSVAQYLKPGRFEFDLVVMDEASQIRPEDALGSIARGKNFIVVGDPKQLPPTSFFQKIVDDGEDDEAVGLQQSESILDSVIPMFCNRRLRWHYRSRHESLIAFSNKNFYGSDLILFPSPFQESKEFGVRFSRVNKGRFVDRKNPEEAKMVVQGVINQLISHPSESVGIVAMNAQQSEEIERQLEQAIKDNPVAQSAYEKNQALDEPLFVKNLENVQGDERDVIVISMTYGPDTVGSPSMAQRFGPINSNVGWRRLNVLFTRSKKRMHIFSSMDSGHIRTSESSSRGVVALRRFLEYCETGRLQEYEHTGKPADSDFEIAVMDALAQHGYDCEPQLGVAGYFLDIAVRDPGMPGRFLMGIECDGATYHSAKSARDRDRLRQDVLENLGWNIRRIWSTDWFKNPEAQLAPILAELSELKTVAVEVQDEVEQLIFAKEGADFVQDELANASAADTPSLKDRLVRLDQEVIRKELPGGEDEERLLRKEVLEILVREKPCSRAEFLEVVPRFMRDATDVKEAEYLDAALDLIAIYG